MSQTEDLVLPFLLGSSSISGRIVKLGTELDKAIKQHNYPKNISLALGEFLALGSMLAATIKFDGNLKIQTHSDGPLGMLVADISNSGVVRGYANYDESYDKVLNSDFSFNNLSFNDLVGSGYMALTIDQDKNKQSYQGVVELKGDSLASCAKSYFLQSVQVKTDIILAAEYTERGWRAGGIMVQKMPLEEGEDKVSDKYLLDLDKEDWDRAVILMGSMKISELLDEEISADQLAFRLFHNESVRGLEAQKIRFGCSCSRDRCERVLSTLPREEIEEMVKNGVLTMVCQFCNSVHTFDVSSLDALISS